MLSLLALVEDARKLAEIVDRFAEDHEGDLTDLDPQLEWWFRENDEAISDKIDKFVSVIREFEARADARENEAARLRLLASADDRKRDRLMGYLKMCMDRTGTTKFSGLRHEVRVVRNGGALPLKFSEGLVAQHMPERFQRITVGFNNTAIRDALEAGELVEGVVLGERGSSLRLK